MALTPTQIQLVRALADGELHSGQALGQLLGISRAAVWKALKKLPDYGLEVHQRPGKGYWLNRPLELLDQERISAAIPSGLRGRCLLSVLASCSSTNTMIRKTAIPSAPAYGGLISEHQSAGRGRQGRTWTSTFGQGIYLSLAQETESGLERLAAMSLVIGVAVCRALDAAGVTGVGLKWPNDLWTNDHKLGGILLEADGEISGTCRWIAGVGLNWHIDGEVKIDQPFTDMRSLCADHLPDRNVFCAALIEQLMTACDTFAEQGLEPFLEPFSRRDVLRGRPVVVTGVSGSILGIAEGISDSGELLVSSEGRRHTVSSGDVSVRPQ